MSSGTQYVVGPAGCGMLLRGPLGAELMLAAERTEGRLAVVEHPLAPRALGSPVHTHRNQDEYSVVLEGVVGAEVGGQVIEAGPGVMLVKPRGVPHAFWNPTDEPARSLEIISPGRVRAVLRRPGGDLRHARGTGSAAAGGRGRPLRP